MPSLPQRSLSRAVLIGTSDFEHSERLSGLPAVRQNLTDLSDALTDSDTGILDWEQCVLIDTPDSPASLMARLRKAASQAEDLLLVYYAGHGMRHDKRDDLYLTVRQTDPDGLDGTAVPFTWVREAIEHSPARTRLLFLDCCYSGMALGPMSGRTIDVRDVQVSGTCVITSSPRNKISHSPPGERLTAFSGELISLLVNGPRIAGEPLTVQALYRGLVAAMANRQLPEPKMRAGDLSGDLLLRRSPVRREPATPKPLVPASPRRSAPPDVPPPPRPLRIDQPQAPKEPEPAAMTTTPQSPKKAPPVARIISPVGRMLLWTLLALFLDMAIGGVVGSIFETPSGNLAISLSMIAVAAILGGTIWLGVIRKRRDGNRVTIVGDLLHTLETSLVRLPTWILVTLASVFLVFAIAGLFADPVPSPAGSTTSTLYVSVAMVLWMAQLATGCIYALVRRLRS